MVDQFEPEGGKIKTGEPGYRVFTFFEEITSDVVNIQTAWSLGGLSCTLSVANLNNKYVITKENIKGEWIFPQEDIKRRIFELKSDFSINVTRTKPKEYGPSEEKDSKQNYEVTGKYEEWVWDLYEGDCIFNCGDPIKVFLKDPFSEDWYWGFCGYLTPVTDTYEAETGKRSITLHCEDTKRWIKQTRLKFGVWGQTDAPLDAIYPDEVKEKGWRTAWNQAFAGYTLEEIFTALLTGKTLKSDTKFVPGPWSPEEKLKQATNYTLRGCGGFDQSFGKTPIVEYVKDENSMHKIQQDLFNSLKITAPVLTGDDEYTSESYRSAIQKEITHLGSELLLGKEFSRLLVEGEIRLIIPEFFKGFKNVIPHKIRSNIGFSDSFKTRLTILEDVAGSLDFFFYALPNGDVVLEFPQYDFMPEWYGAEGISVFNIDKNEVTKWDFTERDDEVVTLWYIGGTVNTWEQNVDTMSKLAGSWAGAVRPELVPRFGWRARITDKGLISTYEGCEAYANMLLNKTIADTKSMEVSCTPKFQAWISRPYKVWGKNFIGFCTQVTHNIFWGQQCRTSLSLNYLRGENWRKDGEYDAIGGSAAGGIFNYAEAFKARK